MKTILYYLKRFTTYQNILKEWSNTLQNSSSGGTSQYFIYHKRHLSFRFMLESAGHSNAFTKSSELERGPIIRYLAGECGLFSTWLSKDSFVIFSHQVWKGYMYFGYLWYIWIANKICGTLRSWYYQNYYLSKTNEKHLITCIFLQAW